MSAYRDPARVPTPRPSKHKEKPRKSLDEADGELTDDEGDSSCGGAAQQGSEDRSRPPVRRSASAQGTARALSPAERAILLRRFVPTVSDEFPELAAVADAIAAGDLAAEVSARMLGYWSGPDGSDRSTGAQSGYCSDEGSKSYSRKLLQRRAHGTRGVYLK